MAESVSKYPTASMIIPVRNEEHHIARCIESLAVQSYPADRFEILVIDGESGDDTVKVLESLAAIHSNLRILHNPRRIIPAAMNIGIGAARGDIILRADAHTIYDRCYVERCVDLLLRTGAGNVGGVIRPVGVTLTGKAIALAVSSPFGVGNAYYRFADRERWVDTVSFGCWRKTTLQRLGGYDEAYHANEDYELNYRLRRMGLKIRLSPRIRSYYFSRATFGALFRQYFRYGQWKVKMLVEYPESLVFRQAIAPLFVLYLLFSMFLSPVSPIPLLAVIGLYLGLSCIFAIRTAKANGAWIAALLLPFAFFTIHLSWGLGFWAGIKQFGLPDFSRILFRARFSPW